MIRLSVGVGTADLIASADSAASAWRQAPDTIQDRSAQWLLIPAVELYGRAHMGFELHTHETESPVTPECPLKVLVERSENQLNRSAFASIALCPQKIGSGGGRPGCRRAPRRHLELVDAGSAVLRHVFHDEADRLTKKRVAKQSRPHHCAKDSMIRVFTLKQEEPARRRARPYPGGRTNPFITKDERRFSHGQPIVSPR